MYLALIYPQIPVKTQIFIFIFEGRTFEQGTRKEEVEKQWNN